MRRLSYAEAIFVISLTLIFLTSIFLGLSIFKNSRNLAKSLDDSYVSDEIYYVDVARRLLTEVFKYHLTNPWPYSGKTNPNYMNPEHPPLGKYIIALSMILCGDKPSCWRLPGALEAGILPVIFVLSYISLKGSYKKRFSLLLAGLVAGLAIAADRSIRYESAVAMLDIHQAFFEALALILLARGSVIPGLISLGLASSVKYSGFFLLPAFWVYIGYFTNNWRKRLILFLFSILIPISVVIILNIPIILHFGLWWWWKNSVIGAIEWETTSRPPGPPTSTPFQWFFNANPFYFSYNVIIGGVVTPILYIGALVLGAINIVTGMALRKIRTVGSLGFYSLLAMYLLLYEIGDKTLYSYYVVQLAPAMALTYADFVLNIMGIDFIKQQ